ncbi:NAD(P)-binding domain-containing protein [Dioscorea alata]|uniref:NAD(P)-binding domain-containing protein n=1 Tax=Dioscorea alata TaxID=55571 RepID=A0ACB7U894_DIOAL|nr:NAD(P)-binding domain-containing protein [Dioscorea alata]
MAYLLHLSSASLLSQRRSLYPLVLLPRRRSSHGLLCGASEKKDASFTDQILDYIEGGPKLRRWYGAPDLLRKDGGLEEEDESPDNKIEEVRDCVLVTDGESEMGQMVILSLILKRARIKALVKDKKASVDAFGTYVEPVVGDKSDKLFLAKTMRNVRAIICPSNDGFLSSIGSMKGVEHIVLLSQLAVYKSSSGIQAIMSSKARERAEQDEEAVMESCIPYTIIRAGMLQNSPGGVQGFSFGEGVAGKGKLSKEDAALICAEALDAIPQKGLILEVANGNEKVSNWKEWFATQLKNTEESK